MVKHRLGTYILCNKKTFFYQRKDKVRYNSLDRATCAFYRIIKLNFLLEEIKLITYHGFREEKKDGVKLYIIYDEKQVADVNLGKKKAPHHLSGEGPIPKTVKFNFFFLWVNSVCLALFYLYIPYK